MSAATFTRTLRCGVYRTIVLGPQQPSIEKIAHLVYHSTNLTTDGSRLFFIVVLCKRFPGDMKFRWLSNESLLQLSFGKKTVLCLVRLFGVHSQHDCYIDMCRKQCSLGQKLLIAIERESPTTFV